MSISPLITIIRPKAAASRAHLAIENLNKYAAHPAYGASLEQIKAVVRDRAQAPADQVDPKDLVGYLIQDNQDIWQKLINNSFAQTIRNAQAGDEKVTRGFKWYMMQDFQYCSRLITYECGRSTRATTAVEFNESAHRISNGATYAKEALDLCIQPEDKGLGIQAIKVLQAASTPALDAYTRFQFETAKDTNWVLSLVAMVACVQSYPVIAKTLMADTSMPTDTIWYKLFTQPNSVDDGSTERERAFFIANFDLWKDHYKEASEIFRKACQSEIDLWAVTEDPGDV